MIGIYKITSPTNKIYVGQSLNIKKRWRYYNGLSCTSQVKLYMSFLKYGVVNHIFEIIELISDDDYNKELLDIRECYWIDYYKSQGNELMNIRNGGSNGKLPDETKEKMRISQTGKKTSDETKKKLSDFNKGKKLSDETKKRISISGIGRRHSEESKGKMRKPKSEEHKQKMKRPKSEEHRRKISESQKGVVNVGNIPVNRRIILQYSKDMVFIKEWDCIDSAAKSLNIYGTNISKCCNGKYKTTGGFIWKYKIEADGIERIESLDYE